MLRSMGSVHYSPDHHFGECWSPTAFWPHTTYLCKSDSGQCLQSPNILRGLTQTTCGGSFAMLRSMGSVHYSPDHHFGECCIPYVFGLIQHVYANRIVGNVYKVQIFYAALLKQHVADRLPCCEAWEVFIIHPTTTLANAVSHMFLASYNMFMQIG